MPREIINMMDVNEPASYPAQAFLSWGWKEGCAALLETNYPGGGVSVALEYGDLDTLNRAVRRAMKAYRKRPPSILPTPDEMKAYLTDTHVSEAMQKLLPPE